NQDELIIIFLPSQTVPRFLSVVLLFATVFDRTFSVSVRSRRSKALKSDMKKGLLATS
ncbi:hypothetical protein SDJN02_26754, partial [Cucurbita argyrosperma subsp. argyrosperma]